MTDRALLEAAARAAGMTDATWQDMEGWGEVRYGYSGAIWSEALHNETGSGYWNPLADDGDVARLEAACGIDVLWMPALVCADGPAGDAIEAFANHSGDKRKARRYASVRAAAAMVDRET